MNGARFVLCCVIVCLLSSSRASKALPYSSGNSGEESKRNGSNAVIDDEKSSTRNSLDSSHWFEPINGLKVNYVNQELIVRYSPRNKKENALESRKSKIGGGGDEPNVLQRVGTFMMMIPIGMQLLQIPAALASVKMSLLKSLLVAKMAILLLFIRTIFTSNMKRQKVIIVKAPPDIHDHYFHHPYEDPEDSKPGYFGKGPAWMQSIL